MLAYSYSTPSILHFLDNLRFGMANFLSSHDIPRFGEHAGGTFQKTEPVALFQMTYIGLPTIYLRFFVSQFVRLLDYANQCILTAVDGHLPIYYIQPNTSA